MTPTLNSFAVSGFLSHGPASFGPERRHPEAAGRRLRVGEGRECWQPAWTVVFTHLEGPLILSPNFPSRQGGAGLVCFPLAIRFMMGKAGFPLTQRTSLPSASP